MDVNGEQIVELSNRTELTVESIKVWINNRKRKDKQPSSLMRLQLDGGDAQAEKTDASSSLTLSKAPTHRRPSGWNLFCSRVFKSELRAKPKEEKMKMAHDMYSALSEAEKEKLNEEAKQLKNARLEDLDDDQIDKAISSSMQRISKEMEYIEQFNAVGYCLVMKPNGKMVSSGTIRGEGFLASELATSRKFSDYCDFPSSRTYSKTEVRLFLNQQYSSVVGEPSRVPYKYFGTSFIVEGWPETVPFKTPARMGPTQLKRVMEVREKIKFVLIGELPMVPFEKSPSNDPCKSDAVEGEQEIDLDSGVTNVTVEVLQPPRKKVRGKKVSCVKKGDIVPVYAPIENTEENVGYPFWLFICNGKIRTDGTLLGRWLNQTEEDRTFVDLGQRRSIFETNIVVFENQRVILNDTHFEKKTGDSYKLTKAACEWLLDTSFGAFNSA